MKRERGEERDDQKSSKQFKYIDLTLKVDLPSSIERERERESTLNSTRKTHEPYTIREGPFNGALRVRELSPRWLVERRQDGGSFSLSWSRTGVDKLATPPGIDESLAFKNTEIGIGLRGFPFESSFYYILVDYFQKSKKNLSPKILFQKCAFEVFSHTALQLSSYTLQLSSHANIGQQNLISSTPLSAFHIYLLCFGKVIPRHYELHDICTLLNQIWAPHCWRSLTSFRNFFTASVGVWTKTSIVLPIVSFGADVVRTSRSMGGQEQLKRSP